MNYATICRQCVKSSQVYLRCANLGEHVCVNLAHRLSSKPQSAKFVRLNKHFPKQKTRRETKNKTHDLRGRKKEPATLAQHKNRKQAASESTSIKQGKNLSESNKVQSWKCTLHSREEEEGGVGQRRSFDLAGCEPGEKSWNLVQKVEGIIKLYRDRNCVS